MDLHNFTLTQYYKVDAIDFQSTLDSALAIAEVLKPMVVDVTDLLDKARKAGKEIMFEGAQGTLLDIDHGTYPYVTSSNTTAGGVADWCWFWPTLLRLCVRYCEGVYHPCWFRPVSNRTGL